MREFKEKRNSEIITEAQAETAILVGLITPNQNERKTTEYLDELEREQEMEEEDEWEDDIIRANRNSGMFINDDGEWEQEEIEDELL